MSRDIREIVAELGQELQKGKQAAEKISKGDIVIVDVNKAKKGMPENEWQALKMLAPKSKFMFNVESEDRRAGGWYLTQKGGNGTFTVPAAALSPTGKVDPERLKKDIAGLKRGLSTGSKVKAKLGNGNVSFIYSEEMSAPPLMTDDVGKIAKRMKMTVGDFIDGLEEVVGSMKSNVNPYIHMVASSGSIEFYSDFTVSVKATKANQKKLEAVVSALT